PEFDRHPADDPSCYNAGVCIQCTNGNYSNVGITNWLRRIECQSSDLLALHQPGGSGHSAEPNPRTNYQYFVKSCSKGSVPRVGPRRIYGTRLRRAVQLQRSGGYAEKTFQPRIAISVGVHMVEDLTHRGRERRGEHLRRSDD